MILHEITFEIDGKLYTTKKGFNHTSLCDLVSMDDLVEVLV